MLICLANTPSAPQMRQGCSHIFPPIRRSSRSNLWTLDGEIDENEEDEDAGATWTTNFEAPQRRGLEKACLFSRKNLRRRWKNHELTSNRDIMGKSVCNILFCRKSVSTLLFSRVAAVGIWGEKPPKVDGHFCWILGHTFHCN